MNYTELIHIRASVQLERLAALIQEENPEFTSISDVWRSALIGLAIKKLGAEKTSLILFSPPFLDKNTLWANNNPSEIVGGEDRRGVYFCDRCGTLASLNSPCFCIKTKRRGE